jgi:hypothetical protein
VRTTRMVLAAITLAAAIVLPAGGAWADSGETNFCGRKVEAIDPGSDGIAALQQLTSQGEDALIASLAKGIGLGASVCAPARWVMSHSG